MLRIGVIGHGMRISGFVKTTLREIEPTVQIAGIVDPDEAKARSLLADCDKGSVVFYDSLQEMVAKAEIDAIAIGTRCNLHAPYAVEASRYNIPLFLEKPVATSMEQAIALENAFEKSRCRVVVSLPLRVSPLCVMVREYVEHNAIGDPEHIAAVNYVPYGTVYWDIAGYRNFEITQGLFLQKATHDFDYMSYLMGSRIVRVGAMWNRGRVFGGRKKSGLKCSTCDEADSCLESPANRKKNSTVSLPETIEDHECVFSVDCGNPQSGMNEDCSSAVVEFDSGVHGVYTQVFFSRRDAGCRGAVVSGYHGTLSFDWYKNQIKYVRHHKPFSDIIGSSDTAGHFGGDHELARNFIDVITGRSNPRVTIWDGLQSVYTCLAARESAEKGEFVRVRQVGAGK